MTVLEGLKGLRQFQEQKEAAQKRRESPEVNWMSLKGGMWIKGRFLNELDKESPLFSEKNGPMKIVLEHTGPGPQGYMRRAECTVDTGNCYVDERRDLSNKLQNEDWRNWKRAAARIYSNFLVTEAGGTGKDKKGKTVDNPHKPGDVIVISQSVDSDQSIVKVLLEYASDGSVTDRLFKITCDGEGTKTTYTLRGFDQEQFKDSVESYEVADLNLVYKKIPYEEQARFYNSAPGWVDNAGSDATDSKESGEASSDGPKKPGFTGW